MPKKTTKELTLSQLMEREYGKDAIARITDLKLGLPTSQLEELSRSASIAADLSTSRLEEVSRSISIVENLNKQISEQVKRLHDTPPVVSQALLQALTSRPLEDIQQRAVALSTAMDDYYKKFCVPDLSEIASLVPNLTKLSDQISVENSIAAYTEDLNRTFKSLSNPWLNIDDKIRSLTAVSKLHDMGHLLNTMPVFSDQVTDKMRAYLGDWRGNFDFPELINFDPLARHNFYVDRGFDPSLTDFPAEAFEQAVTVTGIKLKKKPLIHDYDPEAGMDDEEEGSIRTSDAFDLLFWFEGQLRNFIDKCMKAEFGPNWVKHQTSGAMRSNWRDKQEEARNNGQHEYPLIEYADFTHYVEIITRNDNWEKVFKPIFRRKTFVQESFYRLYPIRNSVMHSRIITLDDELFLYAEVKQLSKAIDNK